MSKDYERVKAWRAKNKEKLKAQNKRSYARMKANGNTRHQRAKLDHYVVYYLPEEHYCGHTNNVSYRIADHKNKHGRDITGWKILYTTKTKKEAIYYEALFCSTLGIDGL